MPENAGIGRVVAFDEESPFAEREGEGFALCQLPSPPDSEQGGNRSQLRFRRPSPEPASDKALQGIKFIHVSSLQDVLTIQTFRAFAFLYTAQVELMRVSTSSIGFPRLSFARADVAYWAEAFRTATDALAGIPCR